jgi:hypothetical protein
MENGSASRRHFAYRAWFIYAAGVVAGSLLVLAIYVNAYDDYGVTAKLTATGSFTRTTMRALSFPLGFPVGALADPILERNFGCGDQSEPCATFIAWWTRFAAIFVQILLLRWLAQRL